MAMDAKLIVLWQVIANKVNSLIYFSDMLQNTDIVARIGGSYSGSFPYNCQYTKPATGLEKI